MFDLKIQGVLGIFQIVRRILIKIFRIRQSEVRMNDTLDELARRQFTIQRFGKDCIHIFKKTSTGTYDVILRRNTSDLQVFNQVIVKEEYRPLYDLVVRHSHPNAIRNIVDAGANVGFTSVYLSNMFSFATIVSLEPSPENFSVLKQNAERTHTRKISPLQKALWINDNRLSLSDDFRDGEAWSLKVVDDGNQSNAVAGTTLSALMAITAGAGVDILKIDIEGGERALLRDHQFLNEIQKIKFIAIELHEEVVDRIEAITIFQQAGFELTYLGETLFGVNKSQL